MLYTIYYILYTIRWLGLGGSIPAWRSNAGSGATGIASRRGRCRIQCCRHCPRGRASPKQANNTWPAEPWSTDLFWQFWAPVLALSAPVSALPRPLEEQSRNDNPHMGRNLSRAHIYPFRNARKTGAPLRRNPSFRFSPSFVHDPWA